MNGILSETSIGHDCEFDQTWGGYRQLNEVARWNEAGKHRVRFELLETKEPGNEFRILGIGTAGLQSQ